LDLLSDFISVGSGTSIGGTATSNMTIGGVTHPVSDGYTFTGTLPASLTFSGGAPVVFDLATFEVTVTPVSSGGTREADFLETPLRRPVR